MSQCDREYRVKVDEVIQLNSAGYSSNRLTPHAGVVHVQPGSTLSSPQVQRPTMSAGMSSSTEEQLKHMYGQSQVNTSRLSPIASQSASGQLDRMQRQMTELRSLMLQRDGRGRTNVAGTRRRVQFNDDVTVEALVRRMSAMQSEMRQQLRSIEQRLDDHKSEQELNLSPKSLLNLSPRVVSHGRNKHGGLDKLDIDDLLASKKSTPL